MDCIIPGGNHLKVFSSAVTSLLRIGKDLYVDFDPIEGLMLRTLNDGKSSFGSYLFQPNFFERCTISNDTAARRNGGKKSQRTDRRASSYSNNNDDDGKSQEGTESRYMCRVPTRTINSVLRSRKGVRSLRIRSSDGYTQSQNTNDGESISCDTANNKMQLCFEFKIDSIITGTSSSTTDDNETTAPLKIVHRIGVADIPDSVTPIAPTINCSLIVSSARVLNKLFINPMKRTPEVAFVVNDSTKVTTVSSFDHTSVASSIGGGPSLSQQKQNNNPGLLIWSNVSLKTETSMACDEFDHYAWRDDRCCNGTNDDANGSNFDGDDVPPNVNEEVCLVFAIKDVKAFLQFCSQASSSMDEEMPVNVYFEWGGRPTIFECEGESFISRLIMATLDHRLLQQHDTTSNNTNSANIGSANG